MSEQTVNRKLRWKNFINSSSDVTRHSPVSLFITQALVFVEVAKAYPFVVNLDAAAISKKVFRAKSDILGADSFSHKTGLTFYCVGMPFVCLIDPSKARMVGFDLLHLL